MGGTPLIHNLPSKLLLTLECAVYGWAVVHFYSFAVASTRQTSEAFVGFTIHNRHLPSQKSGLHDSWLTPLLGGRQIDLKDAQWHSFRDSLRMLVPAALIFVALRRVFHQWRRQLGLLYVAVFLVVMHEADVFWLLAFTGGNYAVLHAMGKSTYTLAVLWALNLVVLVGNDYFEGYSFVGVFGDSGWTTLLDGLNGEMPWHHTYNLVMLRMISFDCDAFWAWTKPRTQRHPSSGVGAAVHVEKEDQHGPLLRRGVSPTNQGQSLPPADEHRHHSALETGRGDPSSTQQASTNPAQGGSTRATIGESTWAAKGGSAAQPAAQEIVADRTQFHHPHKEYRDMANYFLYLFYPPLYIAGPTITFNDFLGQENRRNVVTWSTWDLSVYVLRFAFTFLVFEVFCHYMYVGALIQMAFNYKVGEYQGTALVHEPLLLYLTNHGADYEQIVFYSYWALVFLWFKFLVIWRFFRLWAICDGITPPENMNRCMNNNYTITGFWRDWHRSFNRWLVRYIYVPLGGSRRGRVRQSINIAVVFTFVGLWHDLKVELLAWGWLFSLFFIPELVIGRWFAGERVQRALKTRPRTKLVFVAIGGALNVMLLKFANLVGYTTGLQFIYLLKPLVNTMQGFKFLMWYVTCMFGGVLIMQRIQTFRDWRATKQKQK